MNQTTNYLIITAYILAAIAGYLVIKAYRSK